MGRLGVARRPMGNKAGTRLLAACDLAPWRLWKKSVIALSRLLVVFAVSGRTLALPAQGVAEIVPEPALAVPPAMPPVVAGLFVLRGRVVPVVRPDVLLGLPPPQPGLFRSVLVLAAGLGGWALLVERALSVVAMDELLPVPADTALDDCVSGLVPVPGTADGMAAVLAPERLLRRRELQALAAFVARAEQRWEEFAVDHG